MDSIEMQFKDKIDEYLYKEHHILGGCCSSIESMKYAVAREVAEKLTNVFIEKACDAYCKVCKMPNCRRNECKMIDEFKGYLETTI